jgi:hypothetical protein
MSSRPVDPADDFVRQHLESRGFASIRHEPDGNVPPDFLVDNRIAIEVRRLIQHESTDGRQRGLTETAIPLQNQLKRLLDSFGTTEGRRSWYVAVRFWRPMPSWKLIRDEVSKWLTEVSKDLQGEDPVRIFGDAIELRLWIRPNRTDRVFYLAMFTDWDSGGLVVNEVRQNLKHCIDEKSAKISSFRSRYPEWWLAVTDHIGLGTDLFDLEQFSAELPDKGKFDKVLIVGAASHFEF